MWYNNLIMNEKQREDVVKFLYDLAKLTYTGLIIGGIISPKGLLWIHILFGVCASIIFFVIAYRLRKE